MATTTDPETVALVESVAELLDPFDATVLRRTVLDHASAAAIAAELGSTPEVVRVRWEILYGQMTRALREADR